MDLTPRCDTQLSAPTLGHSNHALELTVVGGAAKIMVHKPVVATDGLMKYLGELRNLKLADCTGDASPGRSLYNDQMVATRPGTCLGGALEEPRRSCSTPIPPEPQRKGEPRGMCCESTRPIYLFAVQGIKKTQGAHRPVATTGPMGHKADRIFKP